MFDSSLTGLKARRQPGRWRRVAAAAMLACAGSAVAPAGAQIVFSGGAPVWLAGNTEFTSHAAWAAFCAANPGANCVERHFWGLGGSWAGNVPTGYDNVFVAAGRTVRVQAFNSVLRGPVTGPADAQYARVLGHLELYDGLTVRGGSFAELTMGASGALGTHEGVSTVALLRVDSGARAQFVGNGGTTQLEAWVGPSLFTFVGFNHRLELAANAAGQERIDVQLAEGATLANTGRWSGDSFTAVGAFSANSGHVANSGELTARAFHFGSRSFENTGTVNVTAGGYLSLRGHIGGRYNGDQGSTMEFVDGAAYSMAADSRIETLGTVHLVHDAFASRTTLNGSIAAVRVDFDGRHEVNGELVADIVTLRGTSMSNGGRLRLAGPRVIAQQLDLGDGSSNATLAIAGNGVTLGSVTMNRAQIYVEPGASARLVNLSLVSPAQFQSLSVRGQLTVTGQLAWGSNLGGLSGDGTLISQGQANFDNASNRIFFSDAGRFVNQGTARFAGRVLRGWSFENAAEGTMLLTNADIETVGRSVNHGLLVQTAATSGSRTIFGPLDNHGILLVDGGTLRLNAGGVHSGTFHAGPGARLELSGTNRFVADIATSGQVDVSGGSVEIGSAGRYTVPVGNAFNAGSLSIEAGGRFTALQKPTVTVLTSLNNAGTLLLNDSQLAAAGADVVNSGRIEFQGSELAGASVGSLTNTGHLELAAFNSRLTVNGRFDHSGTGTSAGFVALRGPSVFQAGSTFDNGSRMLIEGADVSILGTVSGAGFYLQSAGSTTLGAPGAPGTLAATFIDIAAGSLATEGNLDTTLLTLGAAAQWTTLGPTTRVSGSVRTEGAVDVLSGSEIVVSGSEYRQLGGTTKVEGRLAAPDIFIDGGVLSGSGTIDGNVTIGANGRVGPGSSPGTMTVLGNVRIDGGTVVLEFGSDGRSDRIVASGQFEVNGRIEVDISANTVLFGDSLSWAEAANPSINATVVVPGLDPDLVGQLGNGGGTVFFTDPNATPMPSIGAVIVPAGSSVFATADISLGLLDVRGRAANGAGLRLDAASLLIGANGSVLNRGTLAAGSMFNEGKFANRPAATFEAGSVENRGTWVNEGSMRVGDRLAMAGGVFENAIGATLNVTAFEQTAGRLENRGSLSAGHALVAGGTFDNRGLVVAESLDQSGGRLDNTGRIEARGLRVESGELVNDGVLAIGRDGSVNRGRIEHRAGSFTSEGAFEQAGTLVVAAGQQIDVVGADFVQTGGRTELDGRIAASNIRLEGGTVLGNGSLASVVTLAGTAELAPGQSLGRLTVDGGLVAEGGRFTIEIGAGGQSDKIAVLGDTGFIGLGATQIVFRLFGGYVPADGDAFEWLTATGSLSGVATSSWRIEVPDLLGGYLIWGDAGGIYQPAPANMRILFDGASLSFVTTPVPEPATWALMLGGVSLLLWRRRMAR